MSSVRGLRSFGNILGLAWWAKVQTDEPNVTYWFGPYLTRRSLRKNLIMFEGDLSDEGCPSVQHSFVRERRSEPLTT